MTRDDYCSHPLTILTVLAKMTKLKKLYQYYDQIKNKFKNKTTLRKSNEN